MSQEIRKVYYSKMPVGVVNLLPHSHYRVYESILSRVGGMDSWTGTIETILLRVNGHEWRGKQSKEIKVRRASQIIRDLKRDGWLEVTRSGYGLPNTYRCTIPSDYLFRPEHSYETPKISKDQISFTQPKFSSVSRPSKSRETEKINTEKCESESLPWNAKLSRVHEDATLYKELSKNSKELLQNETYEDEMNSEEENYRILSDEWDKFLSWSEERLTKSSNLILKAVKLETKGYCIVLKDLPESLRMIIVKYFREEVTKPIPVEFINSPKEERVPA
ncbi:hypothetical protein [Leptospira stimsonii]|uniref:hypothetical protein n=1 Tax=Leptospira stimsonii TaxID=2202203 RepID=UPI001084053A|nr:hypothetical protein [Leptospira stimsonii]TGK12830.1 hypothetical protein EHO98_19520 [Leptospira stimsonii]